MSFWQGCLRYPQSLVILVLFSLGLATTARAEILYHVQWPDRELWLLGTIHLAAQSSTELTTKAKQAISSSDRLWMEITSEELTRSSDLLFQQGLHDYPYLKEKLSPELWNELAAMSARVGLAPTVMQRMEPWLVEYIVLVLWLRHEGFDTQQGIDYQVMRFAAVNATDIHGLESAEEQVTVLAHARNNITAEEHIKDVLEQLKVVSTELAELERDWQKGDLDSIWAKINEQLSPYTQHVLLVERNQNWLRKVRAELKENEQHFMAVGAAHLPGEQGMLALFERSGGTVTKH
ncbi:TraB/GumN family protein [Aliidiomarina quisquiliarum]|uniref:TraB/GumN family protein n=1 Tax=Aliidiomarina quisquiliarum TaxID=2938947 RepID=UPI00208F32D3|nr:TraB/GumN family protein [Aliidiomarina quisquiliarum]